MKIFLIAALVAAATAEPYYGGYGYGGYGHGGYAGHYGGGSSYVGRTIWGLGKRSADAEPEAEAEAVAAPEAAPEAEPHYGYGYGLGYYGPGIAGHPGLATSFVARSPQGLRGKRSAEPYYGYYGQYSWPSYSAPGFTSTVHRSLSTKDLCVWGARGKRSADPEPYYGYGYGLGYYGHGHLGIAGHPGHATSFVARSPQGLRGKRSADAEPHYGGYGYGHVGYGYGLPSGYAHFSGLHHYGKRSAEAEPYYGRYGYGGYGYGGYGYGGYGYGRGYGYYG